MHGQFGNPRAVEREIQGQFSPSRDKIVTRKFGIVAKALWPEKTAFYIAEVCNCDERQAKRYLTGEYPVPYIMVRRINDLLLGIE